MEKESTLESKVNLFHLFLIFTSWLIIHEATPLLNQLLHFRQSSLLYSLAALRMTLMFLATYLYVRLYEKQRFVPGFHFHFGKIGRNILWAFLFFLLAGVILMIYQFLIVRPLLKHTAEASMAASPSAQALKPFFNRLVEFAYVVYEGVIEVLIFIGFLLDRLARKWSWPLAIVVANLAFGIWHFSYWKKGFLEGSLMILLTVIAGTIISLNYWKTRTSFSSAVCHTLVDFPSSIRELLGIL